MRLWMRSSALLGVLLSSQQALCFQAPHGTISQQRRFRTVPSYMSSGANNKAPEVKVKMRSDKEGSKREMLRFAIPALGIFLSSPLLSNIDNAFVGRTVGATGLAALSPATICTDQMLYLFTFLSRATTGIVSRAYSRSDRSNEENVAAAQKAASAPLSVAIACGLFLSIFYAFCTPKMLAALNVDLLLRKPAASYMYWRGAIAWAALAQSVSLSIMLATRDAISPLKIIGLAAIVNVVGDALLCVYPLRWGCSGAAAATAFATLFSSGFLIKDLSKKKLLPRIKLPSIAEFKELFEYVGPLFIITITRLLGFVSMQRQAMTLGVQSLAGYQICVNTMILFLLFGEPLSQLFQTKLPALIDEKRKDSIVRTIKSVSSLALYTAVGVGTVSYLCLLLGTGFFTSDQAVQGIVQKTAPCVCIAIMAAILGVAVDGSLLASRDFGFIIVTGVWSCVLQLFLLKRCTTLNHIFLTFALRLGSYFLAGVGRIALGGGALGKILKAKLVNGAEMSGAYETLGG